MQATVFSSKTDATMYASSAEPVPPDMATTAAQTPLRARPQQVCSLHRMCNDIYVLDSHWHEEQALAIVAGTPLRPVVVP